MIVRPNHSLPWKRHNERRWIDEGDERFSCPHREETFIQLVFQTKIHLFIFSLEGHRATHLKPGPLLIKYNCSQIQHLLHRRSTKFIVFAVLFHSLNVKGIKVQKPVLEQELLFFVLLCKCVQDQPASKIPRLCVNRENIRGRSTVRLYCCIICMNYRVQWLEGFYWNWFNEKISDNEVKRFLLMS